MFYVWKRNDGVINASAGSEPRGWHNAGQEPVTFEILGTFADTNWGGARELIEQEQLKHLTECIPNVIV